MDTHKYSLGQAVKLEKSIRKPIGVVVAHERSYGLPTYQVKFESETLTLCEDDLSEA